MEAVGLKLPIGSACLVMQDGHARVEAEVVGFSGDRLYLMPASEIYGLTPGASVIPLENYFLQSPVLGRSMRPKSRAGAAKTAAS